MKKRGVQMIWLIAGIIFSLNFSALAQGTAQTNPPENLDWFLRDPETDHLQGVSAEKTYKTLLKDKPSKTVLVAVIDSGIDIDHEDLKSIIWTNEDEIPGNGIDDDKNGYVDDIHGWNFLGGKDGKNVSGDTYELTREYIRLKPKYENVNENKIKKKDKAEYEYWLEVSEQFKDDSIQAIQQYEQYAGLYDQVTFCIDTLKSFLGVEELTPELVNGVQPSDQIMQQVVFLIKQIYKNTNNADIEEVAKEIKEGVDHFENKVKYGYNTSFNASTIVGDDPNNLYEKGYGNNDVTGPDASHGTHVAGIIGADRNNNLGIKGIADNVKIMSVRAVPNGDEHDKDVANAIIYAVDNGAKVINMSFGKDYSPHKELVDKAVKYAESKDVLLIHAAGNDGKNIDSNNNFPTRFYLKSDKEPNNWIEVGAISSGGDENLVAPFSNYGKKSVHLFAPGVDVYSCIPGSKYKSNSGTSMASPAACGVAAMIRSYFPELTAAQVKGILLQSTRKFDNLKVSKPGDGEEILFPKLSVTGGVVNAYEAVKLAEEVQKGKKIE